MTIGSCFTAMLIFFLFSSLTLLLVFLPGAQLYSFRRRWVKEKWRWRWRLACLAFPITLIFFKVGFLPLHFSSNFLPGCPLVEPESKDDGDEHQDDRLRGHLGVPAPALPPALHHLLEVGHHTLTPAGGLVGTHISDCEKPSLN